MIRKIILALFTVIMTISVQCQDTNNKTALLVIDIQEFYFPGGDMPLYQPEQAAGKALLLIDSFRKEGEEVIYISHNYEPGGSIHEMVKPLPGEKVISKNSVNSFLDTGLQEYLNQKGINRLVICGMQTHMCVEAAVRAASDLGYDCTLIHDACTTRDLKYNDHIIKAIDVHLSTLSSMSSYAKIISTKNYLGQ